MLEINPKHVNANYNLGLIFYKLNEIKKAKSYLQKTTELQSNYALAFFSLANVHVDLKEFENISYNIFNTLFPDNLKDEIKDLEDKLENK